MIACQRENFSIPPEVSYLNCAYMSPLMNSVVETGQKSLLRKAQPFKITSRDFYETGDELRREFAKLINCSDPERIAIIPSVSYGIATAAKNIDLQKGQNVVVLGEQFPSNYYTWEKKCREANCEVIMVNAPENSANRTVEWNHRILEAINSSTALVALGSVHWSDGTVYDLQAIRDRTWEVGAKLIIDGTQSVGAMPIDIATLQPDVLICAGYKWLMCPYSISFGYFAEDFDSGEPLEHNWINRLESENFARLVDYQDMYMPKAGRYQMGEQSNFILAPMALTAIRQLNEWTPQAIQEYCKHIVGDRLETLRNRGFWFEEAKSRGNHLFGIRMPEDLNIDQVKANLEEKSVFVSIRGSAIRVGPHLYNTTNDIDKLVESLLSA